MRELVSPTSAKTSSLATNAGWVLVGKTLGFVITTALPLILARRLNLTEFGNYKQFFLLLMSVANLLPLGMQMSVYYFLPRAKTAEDKAHTISGVLLYYVIATGLAGGLLIVNPHLIETLFHSPALGESARLIGLTLIFFVISGIFECVTVAHGEARIGAAVMIGSNLMRTSVILVTALIWGNVQAIIWGTLIYSMLYVVLLLVYLESRFPGFWRTFDWRKMRELLWYTIPLGAAGFLANLQTDLHNYFVSHRYGPAVFAIYAQGLFQLPLVGILNDSVGSVLIPRVSVLQQMDVCEEVVDLMAKVMRYLSLVYFPVWAFLTVMARDFIVLLFTERFLESVPIFQINLLLMPLSIIMIDPIIRAYKEQRFWMLKFNLITLVALLVVLRFGMGWFGLLGTIACVVASQLITKVGAIIRLSGVLHFSWRDIWRLRDVGKIGVASISAGIAAYAVRTTLSPDRQFVPLLVCGLLFVGVYAAILLIWKVPTKDELAIIRLKFLRLVRLAPLEA
jgi:O-antigen/teichoic acid export membrane protein